MKAVVSGVALWEKMVWLGQSPTVAVHQGFPGNVGKPQRPSTGTAKRKRCTREQTT